MQPRFKNSHIFILFFVLIYNLNYSQDYLYGHWNFDDKNNWQNAVVGNSLDYVGTKIKTIETIDYYDGAVYLPRNNYLIAEHGILSDDSNDLVNEYTIVMDIMVALYPRTYCLVQTDTLNESDADIKITGNAQIGSDLLGYSSENLMRKNTWYRLAISFKAGNFSDFYLNGSKVFSGNILEVNGDLSLTNKILLFADDNQEDNSINVADVKVFGKALNEDEISALGGFPEQDDSLINIYLQNSNRKFNICLLAFRKERFKIILWYYTSVRTASGTGIL